MRLSKPDLDLPPLQRGLGQRLQTRQPLPADSVYYAYLHRRIKYPALALRNQLEGAVRLILTLTPAGTVQAVQVQQADITSESPNSSTKAADLDAARRTMIEQARLIVRGLRFAPATTATQELLTITYRIQ